jgi:hypothetical protein
VVKIREEKQDAEWPKGNSLGLCREQKLMDKKLHGDVPERPCRLFLNPPRGAHQSRGLKYSRYPTQPVHL